MFGGFAAFFLQHCVAFRLSTCITVPLVYNGILGELSEKLGSLASSMTTCFVEKPLRSLVSVLLRP